MIPGHNAKRREERKQRRASATVHQIRIGVLALCGARRYETPGNHVYIIAGRKVINCAECIAVKERLRARPRPVNGGR